MTADRHSIVAQAEWLAHRYDATGDMVQFRHVARARHADGPFLTDEYLGEATDIVPLPMAGAMAAAAPGSLHFIFHSGFCASTLLARAFDVPGLAMGLSEPVILNDIVGIRRRGGEPRAVARALDGAMRLLARPYAPGEAVIVKPSNVINPLAQAMLQLRPDTRAVLLFAPLPIFLASVARKGMWCRLWARELLEGLLRDQAVDLGFDAPDYFRQTDLQVAAVGWLAQHKLFAHLARTLGPDRVRTLDSETLLSNPAGSFAALSAHYGLAADASQIASIAAGPAFQRHSKTGVSFSKEARLHERADATAAHGDEIEKVSRWAAAVAETVGMSMALPHPLFD